MYIKRILLLFILLFSERERRELTFTFAIMLSPVRLSSVCLSSETLEHPTQAVIIFSNISTALRTLAIR